MQRIIRCKTAAYLFQVPGELFRFYLKRWRFDQFLCCLTNFFPQKSLYAIPTSLT